MRSLFLATLCAIVGLAQQQTLAVRNAADPANDAVAPGSFIYLEQRGPSLIGTDLLGRVAVQMKPAGSDAWVNVQPVAGPGRIWALLPAGLPPGTAALELLFDGAVVSAGTARVVPSSPGLFAQFQGGYGPALAQNVSWNEPPVLNMLTSPALPGQYITLWGTGLGTAAGQATAEVGGVPVAPTYAGPAPGYPGLDQINFPLPEAAPDGCYVSVRLRTAGGVSNELMLSKASKPGACEHPFGLSAEQVAALGDGGSVLALPLRISSEVTSPPAGFPIEARYTRTEGAHFETRPKGAFELALLAQPLRTDSAYFGCEPETTAGVYGMIAPPTEVDAGALKLLGPGRSVELEKSGPFYIKAFDQPEAVASPKDLPAPVFAAGQWRFGSAGGATIDGFDAELRLPGLRWTNRDEIAAIDRAQDLTVTWDAGAQSEADVATVQLSSGFFPQDLPAGATASGLVCRAPATAGKLVIPSAVLRTLPASAAVPGLGAARLKLSITPHPQRRTRFPLPLKAGGQGIGIFDFTLSETLRTHIR